MRGLLTTIAVVVQLGGGAIAGPDPSETETAAQLHLDRGVEAFHAHDYAQAHHEFDEASRLAPDRPNPYRWLALTEVQLGDCPPALDHIAAFLERVPRDDKRIDEMVRLRALCNHVGDRLAPTPAPAPRRPITRRWWFWAAIGGATAVAVTVAVIATRGEDVAVLPPIQCGATGCAP